LIKIVDNFFDKEVLEKVQSQIQTLPFTPRFSKYPDMEKRERNKNDYYGSRFNLFNDQNLFNIFISNAEKNFGIKIKECHPDSGIDIRNLDHFKPHEDTDVGVYNIMVMLKGPKAVTNGTVFYSDGELDMHVGFKENRSIMFPSDWFHSAHASNVPNLRRYTATLFIQNYESI